MRSLRRTNIAITLAVAFIANVSNGGAASFTTSEEVIPPQVADVTREQIQHYFDTTNFTGVPLLDPKVDWNQFANWPDEFVFRGQTYTLRLVDCSGGDYTVELKSRNEVRPGMALLANYRMHGTNLPGTLSPSGYWLKDGSIHDKILDFRNDHVFGYKFYSTGQLYCFTRDDFKTKQYRLEYFDRGGKLVGVRFHRDGHGAGQREWKGVVVDSKTFNKATLELFSEE